MRELMAAPGATARAIEAMERAIAAEGSASVHPRVHVDHPPGGGTEASGRSLRLLPALMPGLGAAAVRIYTMQKEGDASRQAPCELILLFDFESMRLRAVIEDYSLHTLRTAAPTGVATRLLARPDAERVAVIGTGRQARGQLAAVASVLAVREVRAYGRDRGRLDRFCAETAAALGCPVRPGRTGEETVAGADVVVLATATDRPVLERSWLAPGTHVSSIAPGELDEKTVLGSRIVSSYPAEMIRGQPSWAPFPDLVSSGAVRESDILALHDVVTGQVAGRTRHDDVTVFVSTGMATWDVGIAVWVAEAVDRAGLGTRLVSEELGRSVEGLVPPRPSPVDER